MTNKLQRSRIKPYRYPIVFTSYWHVTQDFWGTFQIPMVSQPRSLAAAEKKSSPFSFPSLNAAVILVVLHPGVEDHLSVITPVFLNTHAHTEPGQVETSPQLTLVHFCFVG